MTNSNPSAGSGTNNGSDRLDLLTDQMAVLTELVTHGFTELKAISQAQQQDINRLVEVTARQEQDINRLVGAVDKLAETTAQQAKTAAGQGKTVDRLALMLEKLMSDSR